MKKFNVKQLTVSVTTALGLAVAGTTVTTSHASDIEIYTTADKAQKTIVMMLDTSGSMSVGRVGISACDVDASRLVTGHSPTGYSGWLKLVNGQLVGSNASDTNAFSGRWCNGKDGTRYYDRMTKLKEAVFTLMDSQALDDSLVVALGKFEDGNKGVIKIQGEPLTAAHRSKIKDYLRTLDGIDGTPTANAYAEAAAYVLGTTTLGNPSYVTLVDPKPGRFTKQTYVQDGRDTHKDLFWECTHNGVTLNNVFTRGYDPSGACQVIAGSPTPSGISRAELLRRGYKVENCRAAAFHEGRECMYKPGDMYDGYIPADAVDTSYYSGFAKSIGDAKDGSKYKSPLPASGECSGQAIYFLTDGFPNNVHNSQQLMRNALADKAGDFPRLKSEFVGSNYLLSNNSEGMAPAGELAKRLRDPAKNPKNVSIKTALVGFGRDFAEAGKYKTKLIDADGDEREYYDCRQIGTREIRNACNFAEKSHDSLPGVGGYGEGGFFYAEQADDLVKSFLAVAKDIKTEFTPVVTGSPTIPLDALLAGRLSSQAYYGSFTPRPDTGQQLWTGDMNKYNVVDGVLKTGTSGDTNLFKSNGNLNDVITGLWDEGVKSKLALRNQENINSGATKTERGRIILTNRTIENGVAKNSSTLQDVTAAKLFDDSKLGKDADRNYWLNALGYNVGVNDKVTFDDLNPTQFSADGKKELNGKPELRQIGATMHSNPILLTQKGKIDTGRNAAGKFAITVTGREDYLLFGSTQGILHVIDNATGKEKFAFIPHEMMSKQKEAFLAENATSKGRANLFYGIDGAWVAHTQYVPASESDPTLTVGDSELTEDDNTEGSLHLRGMQWVYGGLRMGGKSYYALDLSNMNEPKLKFHIDPENGVVHTGDNTISYPELRHMGQSWSKPTLGYVRWNGQQKLVMFVGGGYDMGYEDTTYKQTSKEGAGVYMFDASSGELLWWASSHSAGGSRGVEMTRNADLQYSVVGINTFDRDKDGLIDTLYFGDLAGQAFRVDLNNESQTTENNTSKFGHRVTRILNEHRADGKSPRFYLMPNLSVHSVTTNRQGVVIGNGEPFLLASFSSGDSSSPLAGIEASVQGVSRTRETAEDGIFVVYDNDVGKSSLYVADATDNTAGFRAEPLADGGKLQEYDAINGVPQITTEDGKKVFNRGWKFIFPENKVETSYGRYKILQQPRILTELLFVEAYNKDESNASSACGGGVRGTAYSFQYCLPTGQCQRNIHGFDSTSNTVQGEKRGPGNLGGGLATKDDKFVVNTGGGESNCVGEACKRLQSGYQGELKQGIKQLRWYESQ